MEFLDEQGVQPCGHKAREKGMVIKIFASCQSNEIPTEYCFSLSGVSNNSNTGIMRFNMSELISKRQKKDYIDSSKLYCKGTTISEPFTLPQGCTWREKY